MNTPLVSVIIPCYNQARFLSEAIESVCAQTYSYFEIIVVNDGSTDHTSEVAARYPQVQCLTQQNQGLAAARNAGALLSRGEALVFLDADDWLLPDALAAGVSQLLAQPDCAMVFGSYQLVDSHKSPLSMAGRPVQERTDYEAFLRGNQVGMVATMLCRRSAFESVGGFAETLRVCEDYDFYLRLVRQHRLIRYEKLVALYRQHDAGLSRGSARMLQTINEIFAMQFHFVKGDAQLETAWRAGRDWMRQVYGWRLLAEIERDARSVTTWSRAVRGAVNLLRYYPDGLLRIARHKFSGNEKEGSASRTD